MIRGLLATVWAMMIWERTVRPALARDGLLPDLPPDQPSTMGAFFFGWLLGSAAD